MERGRGGTEGGGVEGRSGEGRRGRERGGRGVGEGRRWTHSSKTWRGEGGGHT